MPPSKKKTDELPATISKRDFGHYFNISPKQLERFFDKGMPHKKRGVTIVIPVPQGAVWYHDYCVEKGRKEAQPTTLDEAKQRREAANAEIAELELAKLRNDLMTVVDGERAIADAFTRVRARLMNLAARIAGVVVGVQSIPDGLTRVDPLVQEVLEELRAADDVPLPDDTEVDQ